MADDIQFPQTPIERVVDRVRHWWHLRRVPKTPKPEPEDFGEPTTLDLILDGDDMRDLD
jgi:hypothetical protein